METSDKKTVLTINKLTPQELGICDEALHGGTSELHRVLKDLNRLPAHLTLPEAQLLLTLLGQLPESTRCKVQSLMDQVGAAASPDTNGGTIIHFPPP
jgi:hypothetical protein